MAEPIKRRNAKLYRVVNGSLQKRCANRKCKHGPDHDGWLFTAGGFYQNGTTYVSRCRYCLAEYYSSGKRAMRKNQPKEEKRPATRAVSRPLPTKVHMPRTEHWKKTKEVRAMDDLEAAWPPPARTLDEQEAVSDVAGPDAPKDDWPDEVEG